MSYRYDIIAPRDYLRLLYAAFFDRAAAPRPANGRQRAALAFQTLSLLIVTAVFTLSIVEWGFVLDLVRNNVRDSDLQRFAPPWFDNRGNSILFVTSVAIGTLARSLDHILPQAGTSFRRAAYGVGVGLLTPVCFLITLWLALQINPNYFFDGSSVFFRNTQRALLDLGPWLTTFLPYMLALGAGLGSILRKGPGAALGTIVGALGSMVLYWTIEQIALAGRLSSLNQVHFAYLAPWLVGLLLALVAGLSLDLIDGLREGLVLSTIAGSLSAMNLAALVTFGGSHDFTFNLWIWGDLLVVGIPAVVVATTSSRFSYAISDRVIIVIIAASAASAAIRMTNTLLRDSYRAGDIQFTLLFMAALMFLGTTFVLIARLLTGRIPPLRSARREWCLWIGVLLAGILIMALTIDLLSNRRPVASPVPSGAASPAAAPSFYMLSDGNLILAIVLVAVRPLFWPLMVVWGATLVPRLRRVGTSAEQVEAGLRWAYFDRYTLLPLPGEASLLRLLADVDQNRAILAAINLAQTSTHLLSAVKLLGILARGDPLGVQAQITNTKDDAPPKEQRLRQRLLVQTLPWLATGSKQAWQAQQRILSLSRSLANAQDQDSEFDGDVWATNFQQAAHDLATSAQIDPKMRRVRALSRLYRDLLPALRHAKLSDISAFRSPPVLDDVLPLRAESVAEVLRTLDSVATTLQAYSEATAPATQRNLLLRAGEPIEAAAQRIRDLPPPFDMLLGTVITRWRSIVAAESSALIRAATLGPVANPYVAGNPVAGSLFVGREDITRRLQELWAHAGQCPSVIIYGHRRMGKSSILRNLDAQLGALTVVVDFNMQRVGLVGSTGELFYNLALALYDALPAAQRMALGEPAEVLFRDGNPYTVFDRFLRQLDRFRSERRFLVAIDEFELIEESINRGQLQPQLLAYWRGLIQTYPWLIMAFAGLHTLEEMRHDYWNPLFGSVTAIPVSFLSADSARRLITQPSPDFDIDYDDEAVGRIIELTNGQPYLVQLICHTLIARFNRQNFEQGTERARRFSRADVEEVISDPEFYRDGNAYFSGVWAQAGGSAPSGQTDVLAVLALQNDGTFYEQLMAATEYDPADLRAILAALEHHDVIVLRNNRYIYTVELMRRWVIDGQRPAMSGHPSAAE